MHRRCFNQLIAAAGLAQVLPRSVRAAAPKAIAPKLSCMLWTLTRHMPFDHCLEAVAAAGYNGVELVGEFHKWSPETTKANVQRMASLGLAVDASSGVATGFAETGQTELFLQQLREQVRFMHDLACPKIILLSGKRSAAVAPEAQRQVALDNLQRASDLLADEKLELLIEPIDRLENPAIYMASAAQAFDLVEALNRPNVKVLFDAYHEQRGFGNLTEQLQQKIAHVGLVHVADVPGRHDPGSGEIAYQNIYAALAELNYAQYIAMEFYPLGDPVNALKAARQQVLKAFQPERLAAV